MTNKRRDLTPAETRTYNTYLINLEYPTPTESRTLQHALNNSNPNPTKREFQKELLTRPGAPAYLYARIPQKLAITPHTSSTELFTHWRALRELRRDLTQLYPHLPHTKFDRLEAQLITHPKFPTRTRSKHITRIIHALRFDPHLTPQLLHHAPNHTIHSLITSRSKPPSNTLLNTISDSSNPNLTTTTLTAIRDARTANMITATSTRHRIPSQKTQPENDEETSHQQMTQWCRDPKILNQPHLLAQLLNSTGYFTPQQLTHYATHPNSKVKAAVAANPQTPPHVITHLIQQNNNHITRRVIRNHNTFQPEHFPHLAHYLTQQPHIIPHILPRITKIAPQWLQQLITLTLNNSKPYPYYNPEEVETIHQILKNFNHTTPTK